MADTASLLVPPAPATTIEPCWYWSAPVVVSVPPAAWTQAYGACASADTRRSSEATARWSRLAIVSMILTVPGLWLGVLFIPQILAIGVAIAAHRRIARSGQRGRRLATAAAVIGCVELTLWALLIVALIVSNPGPGAPILG